MSGARSRDALARLSPKTDPLTSLVLAMPVFVVYHVGLLFLDVRNGADLVTGLVLRLLDFDRLAYVGATLAIAAVLAFAAYRLRGEHAVHPRALLPVLAESAVLAVGMLVLCGWATSHLVPNATGDPALGVLPAIVLSAGAGFHEEVVFRVGLFGGLRRWAVARDRGPLAAFALAAVASAFVFSLAHYVGSLGDAFSLVSFVFRVVSGVYLAAVYHLRGFAVAVYTHTVYDLLVFLVL